MITFSEAVDSVGHHPHYKLFVLYAGMITGSLDYRRVREISEISQSAEIYF